jgi:hypothetical protein
MAKRLNLKLMIVALLVLVLATGAVACKKKKPLVVAPNETTATAEVPVEEPTLWPYTGVESEDASAVLARPLSVKIENSAVARPQTGLNSADVVYETEVEGGITRFNAIFQSKVPAEVGPVRSARLSDLWIVPQYGDGLFFFSGSNGQVSRKMKKAKLTRMYPGVVGSAMHRVSFKSAPHNLYLTLEDAYKIAKKKDKKTKTSPDAPYTGLVFGDAVNSSATTATAVTIPFSPNFKMKWTYSAEDGVWKRSTNGKKQTDRADGSRITAANVVVLWAKYTQQKKLDPAHNPTWAVGLGGEGKCAIFKAGKRIDGIWKATKDAPPTFTDLEGNEIALNPGRTWFEVPRDNIKIKVKTD